MSQQNKAMLLKYKTTICTARHKSDDKALLIRLKDSQGIWLDMTTNGMKMRSMARFHTYSFVHLTRVPDSRGAAAGGIQDPPRPENRRRRFPVAAHRATSDMEPRQPQRPPGEAPADGTSPPHRSSPRAQRLPFAHGESPDVLSKMNLRPSESLIHRYASRGNRARCNTSTSTGSLRTLRASSRRCLKENIPKPSWPTESGASGTRPRLINA
jgi:hypothetical protein